MLLRGKTNISCARLYIKHARQVRIVTTSAFCILALLTLLAVFPIVNHKESAEATAVSATTSLSIISSKDTASVDIKPNSNSGTFVMSEASDMAEFSVTTDNLTGYSVTLLGSDTSGQLINTTTGDTLDTLSSDTDEGTFRNGSASSYANKWGYRLNINSTTTTDFMAAPTTSTAKTIYSTSAPNAPSTPDDFTLALGARIDYEKPSGTYTNTFILTAVGNPISYQINYLDNTGPGGTTGSDVSNLPASEGQSNITASSFTLSTDTPDRTGYDFIGWCYGTVNHTVDPSTCTGTTYQAGENFSFTSMPSTGTAEANLYAMWEDKKIPEIQNLDPSLCTATPREVVDARDGKIYTVARLADGNCWMTSDLNLAGGTKLYSETSDVPTGYPESGGTGYYALPTSAAFSSDTKAYVYNSGNETTNQADCYSGHPCNSYYSWLAATAGGKDASGNTIISKVNAPYSICPKGWRLPTSNAGGDFYKLVTAYGVSLNDNLTATSSIFYRYAGPGTTPNFLFSGAYGASGFTFFKPNQAYYWSSTSESSSASYAFHFTSSFVSLTNNSIRNQGSPIRCVRNDTMQNFTSQQADDMVVGETKTLEDERDWQIYSITKTPDGNVWMTRNLAIGCSGVGPNYGRGRASVEINSSNSNVSDAWNIGSAGALTSGDDYTNPLMQCSNTYGAWYNYAAASANTIYGFDNTAEAEYSICPKGWRLPANSEFQTSAEFQNSFHPVLGGRYSGGTVNTSSGNGFYWSSTAASGTNRYEMHYLYSGHTLEVMNWERTFGFYVRCIKD